MTEYRYMGRKYLDKKGKSWKVVRTARLDGRTYLQLRRVWNPLSKPRYARAHDKLEGAIVWLDVCGEASE